MKDVLETYVFSPAANEPGVDMLARFFSGLVHPMIHFGHGPEFGLPGLAAEGTVPVRRIAALTNSWKAWLCPP